MEDNATDVTSLADAPDFESFKKIRHQDKQPPAEPAESAPQPVEGKEDQPPAGEQPEPKAAKPAKVTQDTDSPDLPIEDRIKALRAKGQHAKANQLEREAGAKEAERKFEADRQELARLRQENQALRGKPADKPEEKPQPAQRAIDPNDPEPQAADAKYAGANGYEQYLRDMTRWEVRQDRRDAEAKAISTAAVERHKTAVQKITEKHPDFHTVLANSLDKIKDPLTPAMVHFINESGDTGMEVLYHLASTPADYERIKALSPVMQIAELGSLGKLLTTPASNQNPTPELKRPAVTRVAPPPRVLTGTADAPPKALSEADNYEEFKRLRHRK